jgi:hypothetical protein
LSFHKENCVAARPSHQPAAPEQASTLDKYTVLVQSGNVTDQHERIKALEQALYARPQHEAQLTYHSARGSRQVSIRCGERPALDGIEPSIGSTYCGAIAGVN